MDKNSIPRTQADLRIPDMTSFEVADWLANKDGHGATDEDFADCMVMFAKVWLNNADIGGGLTKEDMKKFKTDIFVKRLGEALDEILFSEGIDPSAWWKEG